MTKIEKIREQYKNAKATKARLAADIAELETKLQTLAADKQKAAENGNIDLCEQLTDKHERTELEIFVKKQQLKAVGAVDPAECKQAWEEFVTPLNKELQKQLKAYKAARHDLCEQLKQISQLQKQGFAAREMLVTCSGISPTDINFYDFADNYLMDLVELAAIGADLKLFQATKDLSFDEASQIGRLALKHRAG